MLDPTNLNFNLNVPWSFSSDDAETPETLRCLWPFFRFSRMIGMCPVSRKGNDILVRSKFHPSWYFTWLALTIHTTMWLNYFFKAFPLDSNTNSIVGNVNSIIYYTQILGNCCYMIWKAKEIPRFVQSCIKAEEICRSYQEAERKTTGLMKDTYLLFVLTTTAQVTGNVLYHTSTARTFNCSSVVEYFTIYNGDFRFVEDNEYSGVIYVLNLLLCDMGWTFTDFLQAMLALMLGRLFSRLNKVANNQKQSLTAAHVEKLRCDHREICQLVFVCNEIFSPLFFWTYIANVGYLFTRLFTALGADLKNSDPLVKVESIYAFLFLILIKILLPSYMGAILHERFLLTPPPTNQPNTYIYIELAATVISVQAHACLDAVHAWESSVDADDFKHKLLVIERFVSQLSATEIGISGCGYFTVTKGFLVTLISALITYEVIILQFQSADLNAAE